MLIQVKIKMSPQLKGYIKQAAEKVGLGISAYIRLACVERIRRDRASAGKKARKKGAV